MDYTNLIPNLIILIAILIVFYWQKNKISALESTINSQSSVLNSVQTFFNIFKVDEVKKYVQLKEDNFNMEYEKKIAEVNNEAEEKINKIKKSTVPKESITKMENILLNKLMSTAQIKIALISFIPQDRRLAVKSFIKDEEALKEYDDLMELTKELYHPPLPQLPSSLLDFVMNKGTKTT